MSIDEYTKFNATISLQLIQTYSIIIIGLIILFSFSQSFWIFLIGGFTMLMSSVSIFVCLSILYGYFDTQKSNKTKKIIYQVLCFIPFFLLMILAFVLMMVDESWNFNLKT